MNIDVMCRACLNEEISELVPLADSGLTQAYERASSLTVLSNDIYPKYLCASCIEVLTRFEDFKEKCCQAQTRWVTMHVESRNNEVIEKEEPVDSWGHDGEGTAAEGAEGAQCEKGTGRGERAGWQRERRTRFEGSCSVCNKVFYYKGAITKHLQVCGTQTPKRYVKPTSFNCGICLAQFSTQSEMSPHLNQHYEAGDLACKACDYLAVDFAQLLYHSYEHQAESHHCKVCFKCGRQYYKRGKLEFHFRGEHERRPPGLCRACGRRFANYGQLRAHLLTHTGRVFTCDTCAKTFKYERSLSKHQSVHAPSHQFVCDLCGYSSRWKLGLQSHMYNKHEDHKRIYCSHCDKTFKNKIAYRQHVLSYRGEKTLPCAACGKMFKTRALLTAHAKWHRDDKPYACQVCGAAFKASGHLQAHLKIHRGERAHACALCAMRFVTRSSLRRHAVVHTGEKPHECSLCGKKFAQSNNMKKHLARHTSAAKDQ